MLAGYPADAVIRAAVLAEAVLKHALGKPRDAKLMLGELIGEAARGGAARELLSDLNWLNRMRIDAAHFTGGGASAYDDAHRAAEIAVAAAVRFGLIDHVTAEAARHEAEQRAVEPASTALLRLDRVDHRRDLDDLLALPRRVLVLLVHGEVGQGHDHFSEIAAWRTRAVPKGQWRQVKVEWPAPSDSLELRLGTLLETFAAAMGQASVEGALASLDRVRERLYVRHVLGWIDANDPALVEAYAKQVWAPLASRRGERIVCCIEVRRAELGGVPLSRTWRTSRAELKVARAIAGALDELAMPPGGHAAALPELASVSAGELADWLRAERQLAKSAATTEAGELVAMTRGGRFDLVVQRLASLNPDRTRR